MKLNNLLSCPLVCQSLVLSRFFGAVNFLILFPLSLRRSLSEGCVTPILSSFFLTKKACMHALSRYDNNIAVAIRVRSYNTPG